MNITTQEPSYYSFLREHDPKIVARALNDVVSYEKARQADVQRSFAYLNAYIRLMDPALSVPILRAVRPETLREIFPAKIEQLPEQAGLILEEIYETEWWMELLKSRIAAFERSEQQVLHDGANVSFLMLHLPEDQVCLAFGGRVGENEHSVALEDILFVKTAEMQKLIAEVGTKLIDAVCDQPELLEHVKLKSMDHWQDLAELSGYRDKKAPDETTRTEARIAVKNALKSIFLARYA